MSRGLLWLALADLGQAWLRSGLAALAIAAAILAVAFFAGEIQLHQSEVLASYEAAGAATFVVQLNGVADDDIDALAGSVRTISDVRSAEAPYSGIGSNIAADTSFLVFRNQQQQEYLGLGPMCWVSTGASILRAIITSIFTRLTRKRLEWCWACRFSSQRGKRGRRVRARSWSLPGSPIMSAFNRAPKQLSSSSIAVQESQSYGVLTGCG
jgi:hypothetical protein